ncbi:hypothetical protein [Candidatus Accumulibacter cognatus]|nr:hypothetical protein [Candidatus Accumulibacter cognatus]HNC22372.1 hypothetical protein [Accumulibacter sp.]
MGSDEARVFSGPDPHPRRQGRFLARAKAHAPGIPGAGGGAPCA